MRTLLYEKLADRWKDDAEWAEGGAARIYAAGTLGHNGVPSQPKKPFATIRSLPSQRYQEVREVSKAERHTFQIYAYDEIGLSYLRIEEFLHGCRDVIDTLVGVQSSSGLWCIEALWLGMSQDLPDETYEAITKFATTQLSSS